jgi:hypothetical protein
MRKEKVSGLFTEHDIISRNDAKLSCQETIPSAGNGHSTVRYGVAAVAFNMFLAFFSSLPPM